MPIKLLVTGGPFDKEYDEIRGELYFQETCPDPLPTGAAEGEECDSAFDCGSSPPASHLFWVATPVGQWLV